MASSLAGQLAVNVVANTSNFNRGVKQSQKQLKSFRTSVASITAGVRGFGTTLLGVAGVGGFSMFVKSQMESLDALGKMADRLGIATQALSFYQFAGQLAGVQNTTIADSFRFMSQNVTDAANGIGTAKDVLSRLNIQADILNKMKPEDAFIRIGTAINAIENPQEKLGAMVDVFGRKGAELIPFFAQNLSKIRADFEAMGGGPTREGVAQVEAFNDAVTSLKQAIGITGRDFVIGISEPALEAVRGLQIMLEATGVIKKQETAGERLRRQKFGSRGTETIPDFFAAWRRFAINMWGEVLSGNQLRITPSGRRTEALRAAGADARQRLRERGVEVEGRWSDAMLRSSQRTVEALEKGLQQQKTATITPAPF